MLTTVAWSRLNLNIIGAAAHAEERILLLIAVLIWIAFGVFLALVYRPTSYDECLYLLSGWSLRGFDVPFAAYKPPVILILSAIFAPYPQYLNPILLFLMLSIFVVWGYKRLGQLALAFFLLSLVVQNVFISNSIDIMGELPCALFLVVAFWALSKGGFFLAGIAFTLALLSRWNVGVMPFVALILVYFKYQARAAMSFSLGMLLILGIWGLLSSAYFGNFIEIIYRGSFIPGKDWSPVDMPEPTVLGRLMFYFTRFYFLSPIGLAVVVASPFWYIKKKRVGFSQEEWCVKFALPVCICSYLVSMLFVGAYFPRFMAPMIPLALFLAFDCMKALFQRKSILYNRSIASLVFWIFLIFGLWPGYAILSLKEKIVYQGIFESDFIKAVQKTLKQDDVIYSLPYKEISRNVGYNAMLELKRSIYFPVSERDKNGDFVPAGIDESDLNNLIARCEKNSYILLPGSTKKLGIEKIVETEPRLDLALFKKNG